MDLGNDLDDFYLLLFQDPDPTGVEPVHPEICHVWTHGVSLAAYALETLCPASGSVNPLRSVTLWTGDLMSSVSDGGHSSVAVQGAGLCVPVEEPAVSMLIVSDLLTCALVTFSSNDVRSSCTALVVTTCCQRFSRPSCHGGEDMSLLTVLWTPRVTLSTQLFLKF